MPEMGNWTERDREERQRGERDGELGGDRDTGERDMQGEMGRAGRRLGVGARGEGERLTPGSSLLEGKEEAKSQRGGRWGGQGGSREQPPGGRGGGGRGAQEPQAGEEVPGWPGPETEGAEGAAQQVHLQRLPWEGPPLSPQLPAPEPEDPSWFRSKEAEEKGGSPTESLRAASVPKGGEGKVEAGGPPSLQPGCRPLHSSASLRASKRTPGR